MYRHAERVHVNCRATMPSGVFLFNAPLRQYQNPLDLVWTIRYYEGVWDG